MLDFERHDIFEPDAVLASQFFNPTKGLPEPEHALLVAVLEDATRCLLNYCTTTDRQKHALYKEAENWFRTTDDSQLFTFGSICAVLGLDSDYLRRQLFARRDRVRAEGGQPPQRKRAAHTPQPLSALRT
jgi:hypothetical protein